MNTLRCPNCKTIMERHPEPDVTIDVCPSCGGTFLDKNELNVLATGMSGDIEYCSIDRTTDKDKFPTRLCPKCSEQEMEKVYLLSYSDIVFDFLGGLPTLEPYVPLPYGI